MRIDLLPLAPADVAQPDLARARPYGEAEGVAKPVGDDAPGVGVGVADEGVVRQRGAGSGVHAQDRPIERHGIAARAQVLRTQRPSFGGWRRQSRPYPTGRIAAGVERVTILAVVGEVEARPVPAADVQSPVGAEGQVSDRVGGVLLAPVLDQDLLASGHRVAPGSACQPREAPAYHAAVRGCARGGGAGVGRDTRRAPARGRATDRGVVGVEDVNVGVAGEVRGEGEPEQAPIPEVVDLGAQVGEGGGRGVREAVEDLDQAALLGNEDPSVLGELDVCGVGQAAENLLLLKPRGQRRYGVGRDGS